MHYTKGKLRLHTWFVTMQMSIIWFVNQQLLNIQIDSYRLDDCKKSINNNLLPN